MHLPTIIRKALFQVSHAIVLSDSLRNFTYRWAWEHLRSLPARGHVCDIGSRSSLFPAFLAWQGFSVSVVEKDERFISVQRTISRNWKVKPEIFLTDFLEFSQSTSFSAILSLFSLQHAEDNDIPAYAKASSLLERNGLLLSVCEYTSSATQWQKNRDDGTLRIYGPQDIVERIERPLLENGCTIIDKRFAGIKKTGQSTTIVWQVNPKNAVWCFLCAKK